MKVLIGPLFCGHVLAVAITSQSRAEPGEHIAGVDTFIQKSLMDATSQISTKTQEKEFVSADCSKTIASLTKEKNQAIDIIADKQDELIVQTSEVDSIEADLQKDSSQIAAKEELIAKTKADQLKTAEELDNDLAETSQSLDDITKLVADASGQQAGNFIELAESFKVQLQDRVQEIKEDSARALASSQNIIDSDTQQIHDLKGRLEKSQYNLDAAQATVSTTTERIKTAQETLEQVEAAIREESDVCDDSLAHLDGVISDQTELRNLMETLQTMMSGQSFVEMPSFLQRSIVPSDIRIVKKSIEVLAGKYKDAALIRVAQNLNSNEAQWGTIFEAINKVTKHLGDEIDAKNATTNAFKHDFSLSVQQARDVCDSLANAKRERKAASSAADEAAQIAETAQDDLISITSTFQTDTAQRQQTMSDNEADVKEFVLNQKGLETMSQVVEERGLGSSLVAGFKEAVAKAKLAIASSIDDLEAENKDQTEIQKSAKHDFEFHSQDHETTITEQNAVQQQQEQLASQLQDKIRLLETEQATVFGQLSNMESSEILGQCVDSSLSCQDAFDQCTTHMDAAVQAAEKKLQELEDEFEGVKSARRALQEFVKGQH